MGFHCVLEGVYRISLAWSNVYLLWAEGRAALIDTGLQRDRPALRKALQELRVDPAQMEAIYLTHGHCDHAGNAACFAATFGSKLYAHREEVRYLELPRRSYAPRGMRALARPLQALVLAGGEYVYPVERGYVDVPLEGGDRVQTPIGTLRVIACPGHTPGHIAYYREDDRLLFSGDAVMNIVPNLLPAWRRPDLSLPVRLFTTDWRQARQSARDLAELRPAALLAGHGRPLLEGTADRLAAWASSLT